MVQAPPPKVKTPVKVIEPTEEESSDDIDDGFYDKNYTLETISKGKKIKSIKSKIGTALTNQILKAASTEIIAHKLKWTRIDHEIEGLQSKCYDLKTKQDEDHLSLKNCMYRMGQQQKQIEELLTQNRDLNNFFDKFYKFETKTNDSISDLQKKTNAIHAVFSRDLNKVEEDLKKHNVRILKNDTTNTVIRQDLESHKMQKKRQIA